MKYRRLKNCYFCSRFGVANSILYNKRTYFIHTQNSRNTQNFSFATFRHKNIRTYFIFTQNPRNTQNLLHGFTRIYTEKFSRKGAKGAERYVLLFLCQNKIFTRKAQKYTETLLRMLFCESLRRLRETIPLRTALVKID